MLGTNDLLQGNDGAQVTARMKNFITNLFIDKDRVLLLAPPPMISGFWVPTDALIEESKKLSSCYKTLASECGVHFADSSEWNISLVFDGIHFSKEGHIAFAEGLYHYLCKELSFNKGVTIC